MGQEEREKRPLSSVDVARSLVVSVPSSRDKRVVRRGLSSAVVEDRRRSVEVDRPCAAASVVSLIPGMQRCCC